MEKQTKCKDCIFNIKTKQWHNDIEIREYHYCRELFIEDYEMKDMVECDLFKKKEG